MRNRVGKLVVATLLAMLLVFGVAVSAMAAEMQNGYADGVYYADSSDMPTQYDFINHIIDKTGGSYILYEIGANGEENKLWELASEFAGVTTDMALEHGKQYKLIRNETTNTGQWWNPDSYVTTTTDTVYLYAKLFDNFKVTTNLPNSVEVNGSYIAVDQPTVSVVRGETVTVTVHMQDNYTCKVGESEITAEYSVAIKNENGNLSNITVTYTAIDQATLTLENPKGATVTLNGGEWENKVAAGYVEVAVTGAADNTYITDVTVADGNTPVTVTELGNGKYSFTAVKDAAYTVTVHGADASITVPSQLYLGPVDYLSEENLAAKVAGIVPSTIGASDLIIQGSITGSAASSIPVVKGLVQAAIWAQQQVDSITVFFSYESDDPLVGNIPAVSSTLYFTAETEVVLNHGVSYTYDSTVSAEENSKKIFDLIISGVKLKYGNTEETLLTAEQAKSAYGTTLTMDGTPSEGTATFTVTYLGEGINPASQPASTEVTVDLPKATIKAGSHDGVTLDFDSPKRVQANVPVTVTAILTAESNAYINSITVDGADDYTVTDNQVTFTPAANQEYTINVTVANSKLAIKTNVDKYVGKTPDKDKLLAMLDLENSIPTGISVDNVKVEVKTSTGDWLEFNNITALLVAAVYERNDEVEVRFTYQPSPDTVYAPVVATTAVTTTKDLIATNVNLKSNLEITYREGLTAQNILEGIDGEFEGIFVNVTDSDGNVITSSTADVTISGIAAAGEQTFRVTYDGNEDYASSYAEVTVTIHKADATIDVTSKVVNYGTNPGSMITVSPKQAAYISFYAGLNAEGKNTVIHVNLPHLVDNEELINSPFYQGIINAVGSNQISLAQLSGVLSQMLESAETLAPILNIDTTSINMLMSALNQISQLEGVGDVKIELSIGDAKLPTDAGAYLVGAVVSDANYNTAVDLGYLVIKPNATRVDLGFVIEDDNFIVTRAAILSGDYDLGSYVEKGNLTDEQHRAAEAELVNVYAGVTVDGEIYLKNERPDEIGAYTQVAYIQDLGNDMYYAVPIARAFVIVADMVDVKFIDENGNVNHLRRFTYDGDGKRMTAKAYRKGTNDELNASDITYYYIGVEGDAEGFFAKNPTGSKLPTEAGAYTVIATYINDDQSLVGVAIGEMVIEPAQADIDVSNKLVEWTGSQVGVTDMVKKNPSDAAATIIVATVNVAGDFSEDGFSALAGVVNFDLPARMDEVVKQIMPDAYANGVSISTVKDKLADAIDWMGESDAAQLEKLQELVNKIDNSVTITFKETKDVDTNDIGMYLVIGAITDPNYRVDADAGLLVIAPDVDTAELKWNYNDANNVITLPALDIVDMGATAYDNSGAKVDELSEKIDYIYIGVDERGNTVFVKNPSSLSTGLYTEIAYIYEREVSANMWVVKPIMRNVLIVAQSVDVDVPNKSVTYGESYAMDVTVTTRDNSYDAKYLTVTYTGLNTDGGYHSTTKPTEIGVYSVVATYIVRNDNGDVKYFGMDTGLLTIKPKTSSVEVRPTEKVYNGQQQMADIHNPDNLTLIKVVVDADKNINILLPDSVYSGTKTFDVSSALTGLETELANLDEDVLDTLITVIQNINARVGTLSINGTDMPVEVGTYTVYAIGYAANTVPSYDFDQLVITSPAPTATVEPTATPTAEPTATVGTPTPAPTDPTATVDPNATATPAPTDPTATVDPNATATPAPTDPTATVDPNATATPAPTDPTATVDPNATATPAPVDPDATATPAPTATAAPEATATTAPTEEPTATPKPLPETGDSSHNALWMLMLLFSGAALLLVCRKMTAAGR